MLIASFFVVFFGAVVDVFEFVVQGMRAELVQKSSIRSHPNDSSGFALCAKAIVLFGMAVAAAAVHFFSLSLSFTRLMIYYRVGVDCIKM